MTNLSPKIQALAAGIMLATSAPALEIQSHTAGPAGFSVNSHLIVGRDEAILVDAQFTRSEARKVVEMVRRSGKRLTAVFVTHGHPDHYLGLEIVKREFPAARVLATPEVIADIAATAAKKIADWKPMYKDDLADTFVLPEPFLGRALELDGERIEVTKLSAGESESAAVLYVPSLRTLIAGDLVYSDVHLWLAEDRPEGWLSNLEAVRRLGAIDRVLPGHGPAGDGRLLDENVRYLRDYVSTVAGSATREAAVEAMKSRYPGHGLPIILELSVQARKKH